MALPIIIGSMLGATSRLLISRKKGSEPDLSNMTIDFETIVKNILAGKAEPKSMEVDFKLYPHDDEHCSLDDPDQNKEMKNVMTSIITENFISSQETYFEFMSLIQSTFDNGLKEYMKQRRLDPDSMFLLYKGGNTLRMIARHYSNRFPGNIEHKLNREFVKRFFKRSDLDFAIYINPTIEDFNVIKHEVTILAYHLQTHMRTIMQQNPELYFDFCKYSKPVQELKLNSYIEKLNEQEMFSDEKNDSYGFQALSINCLSSQRRSDFAREFKTKFSLDVEHRDLQKNPSGFIYVSINEALRFRRCHEVIQFNLVRSKISFNVNFLTEKKDMASVKVGGELIDVAIPYKPDSQHFYNELGKQDVVISNEKGDRTVTITTYTTDSFFKDLSRMIFEDYPLPWEAQKYQKRVTRYMLLFFLLMNESIVEIFDRVSIVNDFIFWIKRCSVSNLKEKKDKKDLFESLNFLIEKSTELSHKTLFSSLFTNLGKVLRIIKSDDDVVLFNELLANIEQNLLLFISVWNEEMRYCSGKLQNFSIGNTPNGVVKKTITEVY